MSHSLTGLSIGEIARQSGSSIPEKRKQEFDELTYTIFRLFLFSGGEKHKYIAVYTEGKKGGGGYYSTDLFFKKVGM